MKMNTIKPKIISAMQHVTQFVTTNNCYWNKFT